MHGMICIINWIDVIEGSWHVKLMSGLKIKEAWYWYEMRHYTHGLVITNGMDSTCDTNED